MVKPYSIDLRERVVKRAAAGESIRAIAAAFEISASAVSKWSKRKRATGSIAPAQMGGYKPVMLAAHRDFVHACFAEVPELILRGLKEDLAERGVKVSFGAVWRFVHAEGLSFKKTAVASEQDRPDVAWRRARWKKHQAKIDPARLVFIDETWTKTNMAPLRRWSACGKRLIGKAPHGHWRLASLTDRSTASSSSPMSGNSFCPA